MKHKSKAVELVVDRLRDKSRKPPLALHSLRDVYLPADDKSSGLTTVEQLNISNLFGTVNQRRKAEHLDRRSQLRDLFFRFSESPKKLGSDAYVLPYPERSTSGLRLSKMCDTLRSGDFLTIFISRIINAEYAALVETKLRFKLNRVLEKESEDSLEDENDDSKHHDENMASSSDDVVSQELFNGAEINSLFWTLENDNVTVFDFWRTWARLVSEGYADSGDKGHQDQVTTSDASLDDKCRPKVKGVGSLRSHDNFLVSVLKTSDVDVIKALLQNDRTEIICESVIATDVLYGGEDGLNHIVLGLAQPWNLASETREKYKQALNLFTLLASYDLTQTETGPGRLLHLKRAESL